MPLNYVILWKKSYLKVLHKGAVAYLEVFCKKGVLRNFAKFTGKYLFQRSTPATLLKNRLCQRCFPKNLAKFLTIPCLKEHLRWLLLKIRYTTLLGIVITATLIVITITITDDVAICIPPPWPLKLLSKHLPPA